MLRAVLLATKALMQLVQHPTCMPFAELPSLAPESHGAIRSVEQRQHMWSQSDSTEARAALCCAVAGLCCAALRRATWKLQSSDAWGQSAPVLQLRAARCGGMPFCQMLGLSSAMAAMLTCFAASATPWPRADEPRQHAELGRGAANRLHSPPRPRCRTQPPAAQPVAGIRRRRRRRRAGDVCRRSGRGGGSSGGRSGGGGAHVPAIGRGSEERLHCAAHRPEQVGKEFVHS